MKRTYLIQARKAKGLNQSQAAEKLSITPQHLSDIESRKRNPSLILALKMAKLYDRNVEELFKEDFDQIFLTAS